MQICRPTPSYAATSRDGIVQYLRDAQQGNIPVDIAVSSSTCVPNPPDDHYETESRPKKPVRGRSVYTIRPLQPGEFGSGSNDIVAPIGLTIEQLQLRAVQEKWVGMRVNLWDQGEEAGLLVKVQYWWRLEGTANHEHMAGDPSGTRWKQCLHDIMFLGPKDGIENEEELDISE